LSAPLFCRSAPPGYGNYGLLPPENSAARALNRMARSRQALWAPRIDFSVRVLVVEHFELIV
jgi:hypothetical protein